MKLRVECYAGRKADERPIRFCLDEREYMVEEVVDQGMVPMMRSSKSGRTMAISTSFAAGRPPWKSSGAWKRFASSTHNPV